MPSQWTHSAENHESYLDPSTTFDNLYNDNKKKKKETLKLEQVKNQKVVADVYTRMKTLKDTVSIKFATPSDARATVAKVKKLNKPYARKIQILTVAEQRAKVMGKTEVVAIFKRAKESLKKAHDSKSKKDNKKVASKLKES